jgi:hypothetical protein
MDGQVPDLDQIRNWGCTGVAAQVLAGAYALPPGDNGDRDRRELLAGIFVALYCAVGSAQPMQRPDDAERNAVHQMVVSSAALAASEAESYLTLISAALEAPASVHLRSLAETVRRLVICREYPALALELYQTALPVWLQLVAPLKLPNVPQPAAGDKDMRQVEATPQFQAAKVDVQTRYHVLDETEWKMWSKRTHGDIYALVDVSKKLSARDGDVCAAINREMPAGKFVNGHLMRAIGLAVFALHNIVQEFQIDADAIVADFVARYEAMQRRDDETGVLRVPVPPRQV